MCTPDRWIPGVLLSLALAVPTAAEELRAEMLAAEAERVAGAAEEGGGPRGWIPFVAIGAATSIAAFGGTWAGARRWSRSRQEEPSPAELTVARHVDGPVVIRSETLARLAGVLDDLEEIGAGLKKTARDAARPRPMVFRRGAPEAKRPPAPSPGGETDRRARYERARRLLRAGHDPLAVRAMTGLRGAEVDLLRAAPEPARGAS
jgi:hypothetical protein